MRRVVAFDFDGTYTLHDSLTQFLKQRFGKWSYLWGLLVTLPWIVLFKLHLLHGGQAKEKLISHFVKGMPQERFRQLGELFKLSQPRHEYRDKHTCILLRSRPGGYENLYL